MGANELGFYAVFPKKKPLCYNIEFHVVNNNQKTVMIVPVDSKIYAENLIEVEIEFDSHSSE